jgi:hypothetical protein
MAEVLEALKLTSGKIFLTLGTVEQLISLYPECGLLYHPTTEELRKVVEQYTPYTSNDWIVWPKTFKVTGLLKQTKSTKTPDPHAIPTDQFLRVDPHNRVFIPAVSIDGTSFLKDEVKKVQGGPYEILDLRPYFKSSYPIAQRYREDLGLTLDYSSVDYCQRLLSSLGSIEGILDWGRLKSSDVYRWFRPPGQVYCPFTLMTRSKALEPYLNAFINASALHHHQSVGKYLQLFATWVFCSTKYWGCPGYEGLRSYVIGKGKGKGQTAYSFRASPKSRQVWLSWVGATTSPASGLPFYKQSQAKELAH